MKTPSELNVTRIKQTEKFITFSLFDSSMCILGSSIPLIVPRGQPITLFSVPLNKNSDILLFLWSENTKTVNSGTFLKIEYCNRTWNACMTEVSAFPYEMFVAGTTISIELTRGLVSTGNMQGACKVTYDVLCKFLIGDIAENELFAEEIFLRQLCGDIEDAPQYCLEAPTRLAVRDNK